MNYEKTILSLSILLSLGLGMSQIYALSVPETKERIQDIQSSVPFGTPAAPTNMYQKGFVGEILSNIFDTATYTILPQFIQAFQSILGIAYENNVPRWNEQSFLPGSMTDDGNEVVVANDLKVGAVTRLLGNLFVERIASTDNLIFAATQNIVFGTNGAEQVRILANGNVGIGTNTPQAQLHVDGNIIANNPTQNNHAATKEYVDTVSANTLGGPPVFCNTTGKYTGDLGGIAGADAICASECGPGFKFIRYGELYNFGASVSDLWVRVDFRGSYYSRSTCSDYTTDTGDGFMISSPSSPYTFRSCSSLAALGCVRGTR